MAFCYGLLIESGLLVERGLLLWPSDCKRPSGVALWLKEGLCQGRGSLPGKTPPYSGQMGGTHPTGILPCLHLFNGTRGTSFTSEFLIRNRKLTQKSTVSGCPLREGNVFTGVCLFTRGVGNIKCMVWYPLHLLVTSGDHWRHVQTCSFWGLLPPQRHLVVATETEAHTVSKRMVCILLECCLVNCALDLHSKIAFCHTYRP